MKGIAWPDLNDGISNNYYKATTMKFIGSHHPSAAIKTEG